MEIIETKHNVVLYSTDCPKCKILEKKLEAKDIKYTKITGSEAVNSIKSHGFMEAPLLVIDNSLAMGFAPAVNWVNNQFINQ